MVFTVLLTEIAYPTLPERFSGLVACLGYHSWVLEKYTIAQDQIITNSYCTTGKKCHVLSTNILLISCCKKMQEGYFRYCGIRQKGKLFCMTGVQTMKETASADRSGCLKLIWTVIRQMTNWNCHSVICETEWNPEHQQTRDVNCVWQVLHI